VDAGVLRADVGRAKVVELPAEETERRWQATTPQWPIMHAVLYGVTRDQLMGKHKANHIQVAYAPGREADQAYESPNRQSRQRCCHCKSRTEPFCGSGDRVPPRLRVA
jgi:hypothetical protein